MRADYVLPRHLAAMRGRLTTLSVSAESGVQQVVDRIVDKQLDLTEISRVGREAAEAGVEMLVHFMIGLPGETRRDINGTLEFALRLHEETGAWPSVQFATPLPGTRLARMAQEPGGELLASPGGLPAGEGCDPGATRVKARSLPLIEDYGPYFQQAPSIETTDFTLDELLPASFGPDNLA